MMVVKCKHCGNTITDNKLQRCPRCNEILKDMPKCGDCKGCSLGYPSCKKETKAI